MAQKKPPLVEIDDATLQQTLEALHQLPRKGRTLREIITYLNEEIQQTLSKGYSYLEIVEFLKERGIAISENTLRQYLAETTKTRSPKQRPTKKAQSSAIPNLSNQYSPDNTPISKQRPADTHPKRHTIGEFVEMPDEL
ncbi:MAG: hypothetical protein J0L70_23465 [Leptolyngbya sp. UWPOB_LEPTO1]|uniref:hypothetical protein n=1 Tax=Leptolyngbya sp. UWPOB_LEPTO1 TaxID=2815653 RepID=UPI001AC4A177|nr:hypothetical protein [Leptolyngbya sp. UWPOB_LEPTO1]MBN8563501.1 hypothetical protein [Leptolyngbya sp. UWPOB_LEPTO1]